jgi:N-glycosylase/DNA lyase
LEHSLEIRNPNFVAFLVIVFGEQNMMRFAEIPAPDFDLEKTLSSGQVFHWEKADAGFVGVIGDHAIYVEQQGELLRASVASASSRCFGNHGHDAHATMQLVRNYFALDHPLAEICASLPDDPMMQAASESCRGLRIMRQPKWECLATFICSSMKQVAHIRQISGALRERFGTRLQVRGQDVRTFPPADCLAAATEKELRKCALGYRAGNLLKTAQLVSSGAGDLESWIPLPDNELCARLCSLPGVGAKVANCVMLFAYERLRAFPIDVWIERVLRQHYFAPRV